MKRIAFLLILLSNAALIAEENAGVAVIRNQPGWPTVIDMNVGASCDITRKFGDATITRNIKLLGIEEFFQPDFNIGNNADHRTYSKVKVELEISGQNATLWMRPYQSPVIVNGIRIYAEVTHNWAEKCEFAKLEGVKGDVRLSFVAENESWGPESLVFPIRNYRWRSSAYYNSWLALVPYNKLYYHRGEDLGALPDRLPVVAAFDGEIKASPLPDGDGKSNSVIIESPSGTRIRYAHMNTPQIQKNISVGATVKANEPLGKTGCTYLGKPQQHNDPHLHVQFDYGDTTLASFPFMIEAYFRAYPDPLLAIAGGYVFTNVNDEVELDATRSLARPGRKIVSYTWKRSDGSQIDQPIVKARYSQPGLFTEELIVKADDGSEERDFLQVRVYAGTPSKKLCYGWACYTPVRDISPGTKILFWNRLVGTVAPVTIDFGDGTPTQTIKDQLEHSYEKPGLYTVTYSSKSADNEPATIKLRVHVEK